MRRVLCIVLLCVTSLSAVDLKTKNILLVTTDGLRWQDVVAGADPLLLDKKIGGVADVDDARKQYWRDTSEARREALMPFLWSTIAKDGQIFGNADKGSAAVVTNGRKFSYPGYNEILTGYPDTDIKSNDPIPNRNVTVLEWLHHKGPYKGKVAAFCSWQNMAAIINRDRAGFPVVAGFEKLPEKNPNAKQELLNDLMTDLTPETPAESFDALVFHAAFEHLKARQPRILYVCFGETDHWGHAGRYDNVLRTANQVDRYIQRLWTTMQSLPQYKDQTTLIFTTDHGRGLAPVEWKSHNDKINGAENIFIAVLGPDTPALGERTSIPQVTQSQIAATLAQFLGEDYRAAVPQAGAPIADVLPAAQSK